MRQITLIAPPGMVTNAPYPGRVGASPVNVGGQVIEACVEALGKARPDRAIASCGKHRGDYTFVVDPRTNERYVRTSCDYDGSAGAVWRNDGMPGRAAISFWKQADPALREHWSGNKTPFFRLMRST